MLLLCHSVSMDAFSFLSYFVFTGCCSLLPISGYCARQGKTVGLRMIDYFPRYFVSQGQ